MNSAGAMYVGIIVTGIVMFIVGVGLTQEIERASFVKTPCAQYNPQTAEFEIVLKEKQDDR